MSLGEEVNVVSDAPGPHSMRAWKPGEGSVACGMVGGLQTQMQRQTQFQQSTACAWWCFVDAVGVWRAAPPKFRTCNDSFARLSSARAALGAVDAGRGRRVQHDSIATC